MKVFKTKLRGKEFKLAVATTDKERKKGLSNTTNLKKGAGMLFVFDKEQDVTFNTKKMNYTIDMLFLDEEWNVMEYVIGYQDREMGSQGIKYVIEVNSGELPAQAGTNLKPEEDLMKYIDELDQPDKEEKEVDNVSEEKEEEKEEKPKAKNIIISRVADKEEKELEIFKRGGKVINPVEDKIKSKEGFMQVLDDTGTILMNIEGGERIFSRIHTKKLVESAKKVKRGEMTEEKFGIIIKEILDIQDNQNPDYVYE